MTSEAAIDLLSRSTSWELLGALASFVIVTTGIGVVVCLVLDALTRWVGRGALRLYRWLRRAARRVDAQIELIAAQPLENPDVLAPHDAIDDGRRVEFAHHFWSLIDHDRYGWPSQAGVAATDEEDDHERVSHVVR